MIDGAELDNIASKGILIGTLEPSRESKGAWSEVYLYNGSLFSVLYSDPVDAWMIGADEISEDNLESNVSDYQAALDKLNKAKNK